MGPESLGTMLDIFKFHCRSCKKRAMYIDLASSQRVTFSAVDGICTLEPFQVLAPPFRS